MNLPSLLIALLLAANFALAGEEAGEVLAVDQDYNLVTAAKGEGKDVRQRMYIAKDWLRIDEFAAKGERPTESTIVDLQAQRIVTLFQDRDTDGIVKDFKRTVSFSQRRERIEERIRNLKADEENLPEGEGRKTWAELNRALLDEKRKFELAERKKNPEVKELLGAKAEKATVIDGREKKYTALTAWLHPEVAMPADSAEVLFLLQLIGPKLREFLDLNRECFKRLPLEMELDVVGGGTLRTKVTRVAWMKHAETAKLREIPDVPEKEGRSRASQSQELTSRKSPEPAKPETPPDPTQ